MKYELMHATNPQDLSILINRMLNDGWELYGDPFGRDIYYCQAVVTFKDEKPTLPNFKPEFYPQPDPRNVN